MTTAAGVGLSSEMDAYSAGAAATRVASARLDGPAQFCLVFGTSGYDQTAMLRGVREVVPDALVAGCSGEGVIAADASDEGERAVAVLAVRSDALRFDALLSAPYGTDPDRCAAEIVAWARHGGTHDAIALLVFPDGLGGDCTRLLRALHAGLPAGLPIVGGAAADAMEFECTYQYSSRSGVANGSVIAVIVRGRGTVEIAVSHGCTPIGLERCVTRSVGGWLHEIDGQAAWSVFKEYLDGDPEDLNAEGVVHLCLGERLAGDAAAGYDKYIIRTPLLLDKSNGALFFPGGGLATGTAIQFTRRDQSRITESAQSCAAKIGRDRRPAFVLQVDCAGRGRILFGACAAREIVAPLRSVVGADTPWIGFHSFGEIAPLAGRPYYHNYSVVLCAVYDDS